MRTEVILLASIYQILRVNPQTLGSKLKTNRKQVLVKTSLPQSAGLSNRKKEKGATTLHILGTIILVSLLFGIAPPPPNKIHNFSPNQCHLGDNSASSKCNIRVRDRTNQGQGLPVSPSDEGRLA